MLVDSIFLQDGKEIDELFSWEQSYLFEFEGYLFLAVNFTKLIDI